MFELGFISQEELNEALNQEITLNTKEVYFDNTVTDYALDLAINESTKILMKMKGFQFKYIFSTEEERVNYFEKYNELYNTCRDELLTGGYEINTSILKDSTFEYAFPNYSKQTINSETVNKFLIHLLDAEIDGEVMKIAYAVQKRKLGIRKGRRSSFNGRARKYSRGERPQRRTRGRRNISGTQQRKRKTSASGNTRRVQRFKKTIGRKRK